MNQNKKKKIGFPELELREKEKGTHLVDDNDQEGNDDKEGNQPCEEAPHTLPPTNNPSSFPSNQWQALCVYI